MNRFNYQLALYRKNNFGEPTVWYASPFDFTSIEVYHGIVGKTITKEIIITSRDPKADIQSRINAKRKAGYKYLNELKDNTQLPVREELYNYLTTYLSDIRTTADGSELAMLAKTYDNTNNKLFNKGQYYFGQWKINGERCLIRAYKTEGDMFRPIRLTFQSREGNYWNTLEHLEDYLLRTLPTYILDGMVDGKYVLDGEIYLPTYNINQINSFIKTPSNPENKLLQFWCYDLAIEDYDQTKRLSILENNLSDYIIDFNSKEEHYSNTKQLILLPYIDIDDDYIATISRDRFIQKGFEGLIMRHPDKEYQFGKRNLSMIKYKQHTDGNFTIIDIVPEGIKRKDIAKFICRNDINSECFECKLSASLETQRMVLANKDKYIGEQLHIEYGERSGVYQLPFHIKKVTFV